MYIDIACTSQIDKTLVRPTVKLAMGLNLTYPVLLILAFHRGSRTAVLHLGSALALQRPPCRRSDLKEKLGVAVIKLPSSACSAVCLDPSGPYSL
jgi:hypothetical protein